LQDPDSGHHIPAGYRKDFVPDIPRAAVELTKERDRMRELDPLDPGIPLLNQRIAECVTSEARKVRQEEVEASKLYSKPERFLRLLRNFSGKHQNQPPNQPIKFGATCYSKPQAIANRFCKQYANVSKHQTDHQSRHVHKNLKKSHQIDYSFCPFTPALTKSGIEKSSSSTAEGPDGLTSLHLKFLGPIGINFLTKIYNLSIANADIPVVFLNPANPKISVLVIALSLFHLLWLKSWSV
jgi:hypothetical protein